MFIILYTHMPPPHHPVPPFAGGAPSEGDAPGGDGRRWRRFEVSTADPPREPRLEGRFAHAGNLAERQTRSSRYPRLFTIGLVRCLHDHHRRQITEARAGRTHLDTVGTFQLVGHS